MDLTNEQFIGLVKGLFDEAQLPVPPVKSIMLARTLFDPYDGAYMSAAPSRCIRIEVLRPFDGFDILVGRDCSLWVCRHTHEDAERRYAPMEFGKLVSLLKTGSDVLPVFNLN